MKPPPCNSSKIQNYKVNDVKKQLNINLTQDDVTFLKAFTDPEIRTAILNNDLKAFLNVTVKKVTINPNSQSVRFRYVTDLKQKRITMLTFRG